MSLVFVCVYGDAIKETFDDVKCRSLSRQLRRALTDTELNKALEQLDMLERAAVADRAGVIDLSQSRAGRGFSGSIHGLGWVKIFIATLLITFRVNHIDDAKRIVVTCVCVSVYVSMCQCVCPRPHTYTIARTRM